MAMALFVDTTQGTKTMRKILVLVGLTFLLTACSDSETEIKTEKPTAKSQTDTRRGRNGKISGDDGMGILGNRKNDDSGGATIGVNSYLWRATLDTLSFMPLVSADPFGGVIITDWYEDPKTPGERFKVNALILDRTLRADGVKITVFKQVMERGMWRDQKVVDKLQNTLEDTILTRARQLRVGQLK
jgi:hypothetical protein